MSFEHIERHGCISLNTCFEPINISFFYSRLWATYDSVSNFNSFYQVCIMCIYVDFEFRFSDSWSYLKMEKIRYISFSCTKLKDRCTVSYFIQFLVKSDTWCYCRSTVYTKFFTCYQSNYLIV